MATGSDIVTDALFASGALGQGDALAAADAQLVLRRLNRMLDSWNNLKELTFEIVYDSFPTVPGTAAYVSTLLTTVGRPISVDNLYAQLSGVDYPIELIGPKEWAQIGYKAVQSIPEVCWIDRAYPTATFNFYPTPNDAYTIYVGVPQPLTNGIALATTIALPRGYEKAIVDSLAVDIAGSFRQPVTAQMTQDAHAARVLLQTTNTQIPVLGARIDTDRLWSIQSDR